MAVRLRSRHVIFGMDSRLSSTRTHPRARSASIGSSSPKDSMGSWRDGPFRAAIVNQLQELLVRPKDGQTVLLFDRLCRIARDGASAARKWTRTTLLRQLQGTVHLRVGSNFRADVGRLHQRSLSSMADVSQEIDGFHVDRPALVQKLRTRLTKHRLVNISGLPGTGKSAILKRVAKEHSTHGPIIFLKSDRLIGNDWQSYSVHIGVEHHDLEDLLVEIGAAGTPNPLRRRYRSDLT